MKKVDFPKTGKTNAARMLDRAGIAYQLVAYEVDESNLSALHAAEVSGEDVELVFKTLVLRGDKTGYLVCVIPGAEELDLKKAAKLSGNKKVAMLPTKELLPVTGYVRGGCSPVGMKKAFPVFIHEACLGHPFIYVSAGCRGLQLRLSPEALAEATGGVFGDLVSC